PTPSPTSTPTATPVPGGLGNPDLNKDGIVNQQDLLILMQYWDTSGIK
ncbi:hypothetical protein GF373_10980, partial [bacterium]|nr:hypothetical protein [bacterium]